MSVHPDTTLHHVSGPCAGCGMIRVGLQVQDAPVQRAATGGLVTEFWFDRATLVKAAAALVHDAANADGRGYCRACATQSERSDGMAHLDGSSPDEGQAL